jgi:putative transposase
MCRVVCEPTAVKFAFIQEMDGENKRKPREQRFPISFMCGMLDLSRPGYYAWLSRPVSTRATDDEELTKRIVAIDKEHQGRYGVDRITAELARQGRRHSPKRVRRLARAAGLACVHPKPYKNTTVQATRRPLGLVDLVDRQFVPGGQDELWYGDVTYIKTMAGWAYMATVIDGYSRKVVGWSIADHMREDLVLDAMTMAIRNRRPAIGQVTFHSDRGSQYTGHAFRNLCLANGIIPSVGKTGVCFDNAAAESFNATLKKELVNLHVWRDMKTVKREVFEYVEVYYNRRRIQKRLGYLAPAEYERGIDTGMAQVA